MAVCLAAALLEPVLGRPMLPSQPRPAAQTQAVGGLQLRVRRLPDAVELVLQEAGLGSTLTQQPFADRWQGELRTERPRALQVGPQALALPAEGLEQIRFEGSGTSFRLTVLPTPGRLLGSPVVSSDGRDLVVRFPAAPQSQSLTWMPNLNRPTPVPTQTFVPPLRARAVAPPVGDMAVGTMTIRNRGYIKLSGPPITLTVREASAKDVLMQLARVGGYGFVYQEQVASKKVEEKDGETDRLPGSASTPSEKTSEYFEGAVAMSPPVTVSFKNEPYERAFNAVLISAGLQARQEPGSRTIFVGQNVLSRTFGNQVSKVFRLNQVDPGSAADYIASLGARVSKTNTITTAVTRGGDQNQPQGSPNSATTTEASQTEVEAYGASTGPLVGLLATTDTRLGTVTLIGEKFLIDLAEQYLKLLDLRQRQVALNVKILDVSLDNRKDISNSFAIRWGNNFIVNDAGEMVGAFGDYLPPAVVGRVFAPSSPAANPGQAYPNSNFFDFVSAQIQSGSTKLLASPTLILQENPAELRDSQGSSSSLSLGGQVGLDEYSIDSPIGRRRANEAVVRVGTNVPTKVSSVLNSQTGSTTCDISQLSTAGLILGARIQKIDDNGFVTFTLSPSVSAVVDEVSSGRECPPIAILSVRRLDTGALRVRDGQTLILTGVISDVDRSEVSKWPILGDIPFFGQFFRSSRDTREKRELVIMVTPRIVEDEQGGSYGYGPLGADNRRLFYPDSLGGR